MENKCEGCKHYFKRTLQSCPCVMCARDRIDFYEKEKQPRKITLYAYLHTYQRALLDCSELIWRSIIINENNFKRVPELDKEITLGE